MLEPHVMARELGRLGIGEDARIVVYGDASSTWGGEGWFCWLLAYLGHKGPVRLLEGGIQAWNSRGYIVKPGLEQRGIPAACYHVDLQSSLKIDAKTIVRAGHQVAIVDVRSRGEWLMGHIPGAVHIPWKDFYFGPTKAPIGRARLERLLRDAGVGPGKKVVYYCTGGIRSGFAWTVHMLSGLEQEAINFEGGIEEWRKEERPLTMGW